MKNLGIVIVDMQEGFKEKMNNFEQLVESQTKLIKYAKQNCLPIFVLEYLGCGKTITEINQKFKGHQGHKRITKYADNGFIVLKNEENGFEPYRGEETIEGDSHLDLDLKEKGITKLIMAGVNRDSCMKKTTGGALKRGYKIFTANDLMNCRGLEPTYYKNNTKNFETTDELINHFKDKN